MYLRHTTIRKDGKVHRYWRLVRSVRVGRRVIQQTVAQLGELDERGRVQARALAHRLIGTPEHAQLFDDGSEQLTVPVRLKGIRVERPRQFGDVYLALALWRGTGLEALCERLLPIGKERIAWSKMAAVLVAARFCEPSSELHIAEDWYRRTALSDLLQLGDEEVNKDRLYRGLDHLLAHKAELEAHLSQRCGELFAIQNEVLLYDVTSTYFEGQAEANPQARRGYSRDHRPDCKQVCIALVVTFDGFPLGYEVFAGNTHDWRTLHTNGATMEDPRGMLGGVRRQYPQFADLADDRRDHGGPEWNAGACLDHRSRHGERWEPGVAASDRPALHHRCTQVRAEEVRLRPRSPGWLAHGPRRRRGQTYAPPRDRRDRDSVPFSRSAQQRKGHA